MKKSLAIIALAAITLTVVGCDSNTSTPGSSSTPAGSTTNPTSSVQTSSGHDVSSPITPSTSVPTPSSSTTVPVSSSTAPSSSTPIIEQVGDLTQAMLNDISNANITVNGTLSDVVHSNVDNKDTINNYVTKVMMDDGKWYGEYKVDDKDIPDAETISENYRRGAATTVDGVAGHSMDQVYINKDNQVAQKPITDYLSNKTLWEGGHLWNHLSDLMAGKFKYDTAIGAYTYQIDYTTQGDELYSKDAWLMTYIPYSLSPLNEDTVAEFNVYLNEDATAIDRIECSTDIIYYGYSDEANPAKDATSFSYTNLVFEFEDIGTTVVPDPAVYTSISDDPTVTVPENIIKAYTDAIDSMKGMTNFTFRSVNNTTSSPSVDDGDYELSSLSSNKSVKAKVQNSTSNTGTIGRVGKVTEQGILYADTGKYEYALDDKLYYTQYSGYKQNSDGTYDSFEYNSTNGALTGKYNYKGNITEEIIPGFEFSPYIFRFDGAEMDANFNFNYRFVLRDPMIARDVAMEISDSRYAKDATASLTAKFAIYVNSNGEFVRSSFPYSLVSGTYLGTCSTTYSDIGTTTLDADLFSDYVPAIRLGDWSAYKDIRYYANGSTLDPYSYRDADLLLSDMYGSQVSNFPTPAELGEILGSEMSGPWYDVDFNTKAPEFSFTFKTSELDENGQMSNFDELYAGLDNLFITKKGFSKSLSNTSVSNPHNRRITYIKDEIYIKIDNLGTGYMYFDCYVTSQRA